MMFLKTENLDREKRLIKIGRKDDMTRRNDKKLSVFRMTGHFPIFKHDINGYIHLYMR